MNRTRKTKKLVSLALVAAVAIGLGTKLWPETRQGPDRATAAAVHVPAKRGLVGLIEKARIDVARPMAARPVEERARAWLETHPPTPELRSALLDIAARAERARRALPRVAETDAEAEALAAARRERIREQEEFRLALRSALRAMTPAERASMRAAHVHIIQLAHQMAASTRG